MTAHRWLTAAALDALNLATAPLRALVAAADAWLCDYGSEEP